MHTLRTAAVAAAFALLAVTPPLPGQVVSAAPAAAPVTIPGTERHTLRDAATNLGYELWVHVPPRRPPAGVTLPLIVLLDGDVLFGMTVDTWRGLRIGGEMPDAIIVGIAYGAGVPEWARRRVGDYTPTPLPDFAGSGNAAGFARFVERDVLPYVAARWPVSPTDRTLIGMSLSGLFGFDLLFKRPDLFARWLLISPAVWWDDGLVGRAEAAYAAARRPLAERVFTSTAALEDDADRQPWRALTEALRTRGHAGLQLITMTFPEETHVSTTPGALARGLRLLFAQPAVVRGP